LELPPNVRVHNVFSVAKTKPYLSGPHTLEPAPDFVDGAPEYEVEKILDHRTWVQYLVKWKSLDHHKNQRLFAEDIIHCQELIEEYLSTGGGVRERQVSRPVRLKLTAGTREK
jgi:hypothetical protein